MTLDFLCESEIESMRCWGSSHDFLALGGTRQGDEHRHNETRSIVVSFDDLMKNDYEAAW